MSTRLRNASLSVSEYYILIVVGQEVAVVWYQSLRLITRSIYICQTILAMLLSYGPTANTGQLTMNSLKTSAKLPG
jgi:hypothetical protein